MTPSRQVLRTQARQALKRVVTPPKGSLFIPPPNLDFHRILWERREGEHHHSFRSTKGHRWVRSPL